MEILSQCDPETGVWAAPFWMVNNNADDEDEDEKDEDEDEETNVDITEDEAIRFVDGLEKVSVDAKGLPPHCIVCWGEWAEVESDDTCVPVRLPCPSGHVVGRDCLVKDFQADRLCPFCRANVVE
jgi:hypothetical protein